MTDATHLDEEALAELRDVMEDDFEILIRTFLSDSQLRIEGLRTAAADDDAESLSTTAHSFKGSCVNIGAARLGELCYEVEAAAKVGRLSGMGRTLEDIEQEFRLVHQLLEQALAP